MKLNIKDKLTADTILETVKVHSEKVLFPRFFILLLFFHFLLLCKLYLFDNNLFLYLRLENRFGESTLGETNNQRPSTISNGSQSLGTPAGSRAQTSSGTVRPKSPAPAIQLKVFSKEKFEESLKSIKVCFLNFYFNYDYFTNN